MNKKVLRHLIGWILLLVFINRDEFTDPDFGYKSFILIASYALTLMLVFYALYQFVAPRVFERFNVLKGLAAILIGIFGFILLRYFIQEVLLDVLFGFTNYYIHDAKLYFMDNWWRGISLIFAAFLVFLVDQKIENDEVRLALEREKKETELAFLRTQMNPHFLFNTLSFLHTEAYLHHPELAETILKLSDILRYSVESSKKDKVTVQQEIDLLKNYIGIFKKRFENKCFVDLEVKGSDFGQPVEPLLLIPFLENAFKHGVFSDSVNPVRIALIIEDNVLLFKCKNKINRHTKDPGSGIGIDNVKKRLNLLYPKSHQLEINNTGDEFIVKLELNL